MVEGHNQCPFFFFVLCVLYDVCAWDVPRETGVVMAKSENINGDVVSAVSLTADQKRLVVACIDTQMSSVKRAKNAEKDEAVAALRQAQYDRLADLQHLFR